MRYFSIEKPYTLQQIRLDTSNCKYFKKQLTNKDDLNVELKVFDHYRDDYKKTTNSQYDRMQSHESNYCWNTWKSKLL